MVTVVYKAEDIGKDEDVRIPLKTMEEAKALQAEVMGKQKFKIEIEGQEEAAPKDKAKAAPKK